MQVWTLFEESNIKGKTTPDYYENSRSFRTFGNFEDAKAAMRDLIKSYATVKGELFDGNGHFRNINEDIIEEYTSYGNEPEEAEKIAEIIRDFFIGENVADRVTAAFEIGKDSEAYFRCDSNGIEFSDGESNPFPNPENRINDPFMPMWEEAWDTVETNAFVMKDPSLKYVCRVHSAYTGEDPSEPPAYFNVELVMTEVE